MLRSHRNGFLALQCDARSLVATVDHSAVAASSLRTLSTRAPTNKRADASIHSGHYTCRAIFQATDGIGPTEGSLVSLRPDQRQGRRDAADDSADENDPQDEEDEEDGLPEDPPSSVAALPAKKVGFFKRLFARLRGKHVSSAADPEPASGPMSLEEALAQDMAERAKHARPVDAYSRLKERVREPKRPTAEEVAEKSTEAAARVAKVPVPLTTPRWFQLDDRRTFLLQNFPPLAPFSGAQDTFSDSYLLFYERLPT